MWPQTEVITLDIEQGRGLHTARALARPGGEPAPVGESALAGRQRVTRVVGRDQAATTDGAALRARTGCLATRQRSNTRRRLRSGRHRTDRLRTEAQPGVQHRGALRCLELVPQRSQSFGVLLPGPLDTEGMGSRGEHRLADKRVVDEERKSTVNRWRSLAPARRVSFWRWRHAAERSSRNRSGSRARKRAENCGLHRIVQPQPFRCFVYEAERPELAPSRRLRLGTPSPRTPLVTRRGTDAASRSWRPWSSRPAQGNAVASAATGRPDLVDRHVGDVCLHGEPKRQRVAARFGKSCQRGLPPHFASARKASARPHRSTRRAGGSRARPLDPSRSTIRASERSRPAMTKRSSVDNDGTSSCRNQGSAMRNIS